MGKRRKHTTFTKGNTNAYYIYEKILNFSHMREIQIEVILRYFFHLSNRQKSKYLITLLVRMWGEMLLSYTGVKRLNRYNPI